MVRNADIVGFLAVVGVPVEQVEPFGKGVKAFIDRVGEMRVKRVDVDGMSVFFWWRDGAPEGQPDPDPFAVVEGAAPCVIFKTGQLFENTKDFGVDVSNWSGRNGRYAWLRWESKQLKMTATGDFLGVRALFYLDAGSVLLVSNEPSTLMGTPIFDAELDPVGCVDMLQKGCCFGDRTLFKQIRFLQPGARLTKERSVTRVERRGLPVAMPPRSSASIDKLADGMFERLNVATRRRLENRHDWQVLLSGGLDSRVCAGLLHQNKALAGGLSWGRASGGDSRVASKVARTLGVDFFQIPIRVDHLKKYSSDLFTLGGGLTNAHITYLIAAMEMLPKPRPPLVQGYSGDPLTGGHVPLQAPNGKVEPEMDESIAHFHGALGRFFVPEELSRLLVKAEWKDAIPAAKEEICKVMSAVESDKHYQRWIAALLWCRQLRYTTFLPRICEGFAPTFSPFEDKDVLEYCLSLPPEALKAQTAYRRMIERNMPHLAKIPTASGQPVALSGRTNSSKIYRQLLNVVPEKYRWRLAWWSGGGYSVDPNADLREGSAEYLKSLANSHEEWGMFLDKHYVAELIDNHLAGRTKQGLQIQALVMVLEAAKLSAQYSCGIKS